MINWSEILKAIIAWLECVFKPHKKDRIRKFDFVISQ